METELHPVLTVRLFTDQKCFGPGVAELLRRVEETQSLRAAAAAMGGKNGGGATLTPQAERLLGAYEAYCADLKAQAEALFTEKFAFLDRG